MISLAPYPNLNHMNYMPNQPCTALKAPLEAHNTIQAPDVISFHWFILLACRLTLIKGSVAWCDANVKNGTLFEARWILFNIIHRAFVISMASSFISFNTSTLPVMGLLYWCRHNSKKQTKKWINNKKALSPEGQLTYQGQTGCCPYLCTSVPATSHQQWWTTAYVCVSGNVLALKPSVSRSSSLSSLLVHTNDSGFLALAIFVFFLLCLVSPSTVCCLQRASFMRIVRPGLKGGLRCRAESKFNRLLFWNVWLQDRETNK